MFPRTPAAGQRYIILLLYPFWKLVPRQRAGCRAHRPPVIAIRFVEDRVALTQFVPRTAGSNLNVEYGCFLLRPFRSAFGAHIGVQTHGSGSGSPCQVADPPQQAISSRARWLAPKYPHRILFVQLRESSRLRTL